MRARVALAALALAAPLALTPAAHADYGPGRFTYAEWLNLHSGETMTAVQNACGCTGMWANKPGTSPKVIWYDSSVSGGHVEEWYVYQDGHWRTFGSYWVSASRQKDF